MYTYAAGISENITNVNLTQGMCPCANRTGPPAFVGSDYYCESGNPYSYNVLEFLYYADILWDGQQCGGLEGTCCN